MRRRGRAAAPPRGPARPSRLTLSPFLSPLPVPAAGIPSWPRRPAEEKQVGGLPPGTALRGDAAATWAQRRLGCIHPGNRRFACRIPPGFGLGFFFVAAFGCVERVQMEKGSAGLAEAFGYWEHVSHPSALRSTDAQTQPRSLPLLGAAADRHLAGGQDLGVREHLFCFAKLIAIWRHAFESWRERRSDAIR